LNDNPQVIEISIRKMELADIERVSEIDQISFSLPWPKSSFLFEVQRNDAARAWVAEIPDHQIVGMIVTWLIVDEIHIATVAADPDYRQHKIGLKLMVHSLCSAAAEGAEKSFLEVRRGNQAARSLYQKLGYIEDGVRLRYYEDNHEDAILMSLQKIDISFLKSLLPGQPCK
jgi:[ribosomal protein S18]-alanine N-acetyltransferase